MEPKSRNVLSPMLVWQTAETKMFDDTLKVLLVNTGKAPLKPSTVALYRKAADGQPYWQKEPIAKDLSQSLPTIAPGGTMELAFVLPKDFDGEPEDLVLAKVL